jgi:MFS family permease
MEAVKFSYRKTLVIGLGFLGISVVWPIFNQFIPIFLQDTFKLSPAVAFFVMTWDNLINVFVQPWAGSKSDTTWNRFGRRKPWIMVGAPIAAVAFIFLPLANTLTAIMVFILITNFGMAIFRSPTVAWLGDLFPSAERSKANGIINFMGGLGAAIALFGGGILFDRFGRPAPFVAGTVLMLLASALVIWKVKEPRQIERVEEERGSVLDNLGTVFGNPDKSGLFVLISILLWFMAYEGLQTGLSSFAVFTLGVTAGRASVLTTLFAASFLLFAIPSGLIGTKFGRGRTITIGLAGMALFLLIGFLFVRNETLYAVVLVFSGISWALINVNSLPLVYDHGDESKIGMYTGLYYMASQTAAVLGPVLSGVLVETMGNDFRFLWLFSMIFIILAGFTMFRVRATPKAENRI